MIYYFYYLIKLVHKQKHLSPFFHTKKWMTTNFGSVLVITVQFGAC